MKKIKTLYWVFTGLIVLLDGVMPALTSHTELARQGIEVEREARDVTIHALDMLGLEGDVLRLRVSCSKGTYIRVLAADIGQALGCGAHLTALRRTQVGDLVLERSVTLSQLELQDEVQRGAHLLPVDALLQSLPAVHLAAAEANRFSHGNPVTLPTGLLGKIRVYAEGRLLGVGEPGPGSLLWPKRLVQLAS